MLAVGGVDELVARNSPYVLWDLEPAERAAELLTARGDIELLKLEDVALDDSVIAGMGGGSLITLMDDELIPEVVAALVAAEVKVKAVHKINPTLEQLFLKLTEGESID
ncbi:hypothetical protein D3C73_1309920 [compost metagenome]